MTKQFLVMLDDASELVEGTATHVYETYTDQATGDGYGVYFVDGPIVKRDADGVDWVPESWTEDAKLGVLVVDSWKEKVV